MDYVKIRVTADKCKFDNVGASKGSVIDGVKKLTAMAAAKRKLCVILEDSEVDSPRVAYKASANKINEKTLPPTKAPKNAKAEAPKKTS